MNKFGKILRQYRKKAGIKSASVAEKLKVSRAYIATIESGRQPPPTFEKCQRMADMLELSDRQRLHLLTGAFECRASKDTKAFLAQISQLSSLAQQNDGSVYQRYSKTLADEELQGDQPDLVNIPLINVPSQKVHYPYSDVEEIGRAHV